MELINLTQEAPSEQELKHQHKIFISGSQVYQILNTPWENIYSMFDPNADSWTKSPWTKKHLANGKIQEEYILNTAKRLYQTEGFEDWPKEFKDIKVDKCSYRVKNTPFSLNVDGYIGESLDKAEAIVEIKSTTESLLDMNLAKERGWVDQVKFYCLCTGARTGYIIALCASRFEYLPLKFTDNEINELKKKLMDFYHYKQIALEQNDPTVLDFKKGFQETTEFEIEDEKQIAMLKAMDQKMQALSELKKEVETFKGDIKKTFNAGIIKWYDAKTDEMRCISISEKESESTDYRTLANELGIIVQQLDKAKGWIKVKELIDQNTTRKKTYLCSSIKKYKE